MNEEWVQWLPDLPLANKYDIDKIIHDLDDFRMLLTDTQDSKNQVWVIFDKSIDVFRSTDESYCLKTIHLLNKKYGKDFYVKWTFFKVQNSLYVEWLYEQSFETFPKEGYTHFAFIEDNAIVDVVSVYEPRFEFVQR